MKSRNNRIHQVLRGLDENGVRYFYKTAIKPTDRDGTKEANDKHPYRIISVLIDIPSHIEVNGKLMRGLVARLPDIADYDATRKGVWDWEIPGDNDDATIWRLEWFQRQIVHHNWEFVLVAYNHGAVDVGEDGQVLGGTGDLAEKRAMLELCYDVVLPEKYDMTYFPAGSFYGP
ncbi:hypothetical protein BDW74DRAFT_183962 [Aspergillus multicolor]|uniref:uncharacterized protein n=1 Tax=Aspergillus multicolor TaxID=41759 RepID=UPI003CCD0720